MHSFVTQSTIFWKRALASITLGILFIHYPCVVHAFSAYETSGNAKIRQRDTYQSKKINWLFFMLICGNSPYTYYPYSCNNHRTILAATAVHIMHFQGSWIHWPMVQKCTNEVHLCGTWELNVSGSFQRFSSHQVFFA